MLLSIVCLQYPQKGKIEAVLQYSCLICCADVFLPCPLFVFLRISITFRRMDQTKRPVDYVPEPDLQGIKPLAYDVEKTNGPKSERHRRRHSNRRGGNNNMAVRGPSGRDDLSPRSEPYYSNRSQRGPGNWRRSG